MVRIEDVEVTDRDREMLSRIRFRREQVDWDMLLDICRMLLEDRNGYELSNQLDDSENFKKNGDNYNSRMSLILATCRLLCDENKIRTAVRIFFTEQNTPVGVKCDDRGNFDEDQLEEYIARVTKAVMEDDFIGEMSDLVFNWYMKCCSSVEQSSKIIRMKIIRGRKLDLTFNHRDARIAIPVPKRENSEEKEETEEREEKDECSSNLVVGIDKAIGPDYTAIKYGDKAEILANIMPNPNYKNDLLCREEWKRVLST